MKKLITISIILLSLAGCSPTYPHTFYTGVAVKPIGKELVGVCHSHPGL